MDIAPNPSWTTWNMTVYPMCSAKHQGAKSKKWATLSYTNLAEQSEKLSVLRACVIPKQGQFTACVVSVWCPCRNKQRKSRIELTSSQNLFTSSNKEYVDNAMDLKIASTMIGKPKMPPRMFRKEDSQLSRKDGKMTPSHRETQREHGWTLEHCIFLDYLKHSKSSTRRPGTKEIATRTIM